MLSLLDKIFCTWDGWSEIVIPTLGAILIPLLILLLTWFFGTLRADQKAEKQRNEEKLIYLRSLLFHALKDFLMFRNKIIFKQKAICEFSYLSTEDRKKLFSIFYYNNVYSQFDPKDYSCLSHNLPDFIINLLQTKTYINQIYNRIELFNQDIKNIQDRTHLLTSRVQDNLGTFKLDIEDSIKYIKTTLEDISYLEKALKLNLVQLELEDFEKKELQEALDELKS